VGAHEPADVAIATFHSLTIIEDPLQKRQVLTLHLDLFTGVPTRPMRPGFYLAVAVSMATAVSTPDPISTLTASPTNRSLASFSDHMLASPGGDLTNAVQYALLAILPCCALFYGTSSIAQPFDSSASTMQIGVETAAVLALTVAGLYYVNRLVTYVPTYSGVAYGEMSFVAVVLAIAAVVSHSVYFGCQESRQNSRLGVLQERCTAALAADDDRQQKPQKQQPQPQQQQQAPAQMGPPPPLATQNSTVSASSLPVGHPSDGQGAQQQPAAPSFDSMYEPFQTGAGAVGGGFGSAL
jgi:hypothetical protein